MQLADLLNSTYTPDGMGPAQFSCWGLVRAGLHGLFGLPLLPAYGDIHTDDKAAMTAGWDGLSKRFAPCEAQAGAVACFYEGELMVHIGLVIERRRQLYVVHTNPAVGPVQTPVRHAGLLAQSVRYYRHLSAP